MNPEAKGSGVSSVQGLRVPFRDLRVTDPVRRAELIEAVDRVLSHGRLVLGPECAQFEEEVGRYCGRRYGIGVGSGTDALYLALRALEIGPGDEVITTALSWIATANAIVLTGATPVFVDIGEDLNIDVERIGAAITSRTKAIVPVHFTGQICEMRRIQEVASANGLVIVEDAAQAFGATQNGRMAGSFGEVSCFSMNAMKVFGAYGEAGAIVTDNERLRDRLFSLRYNGTVEKQDCHWPSLNGRLDTVQAAMLLVELEYLSGKIARRREIARMYTQRLAGTVQCPVERLGNRHIYYAYSVLAERRDALMQHFAAKGIETQVQHPLPMPRHTAYRERFSADVPVADRVSRRLLCLPNQDNLPLDHVSYVCDGVEEFYAR